MQCPNDPFSETMDGTRAPLRCIFHCEGQGQKMFSPLAQNKTKSTDIVRSDTEEAALEMTAQTELRGFSPRPRRAEDYFSLWKSSIRILKKKKKRESDNLYSSLNTSSPEPLGGIGPVPWHDHFFHPNFKPSRRSSNKERDTYQRR